MSSITALTNVHIGPYLASKWPGTISHHIDNIVVDHRDSVAIKDGIGNILTYQDMSERVDMITSALCDAGVGEGSQVAVFQEPTSDWMCSMLAIWKAGAVYVPLDMRNTFQRLVVSLGSSSLTMRRPRTFLLLGLRPQRMLTFPL